MNWLIEPFGYAFFNRALVVGILIGAMCGALGVFIVLRRMSYIGHGLAHSVLGGAVVGVAFGQSLYVGMIGATVLSALLIDRIARRRGLHADSAIGIVTTAMFALGIAVVSVLTVRVNLEALLFGNVLGVRAPDLALVVAVGATFGLVLLRSYKSLVFSTFDPEVASVQGVRIRRVDLVFNLLTAVVVIASVRVLGVLLIAAAVVVPAAAARLLSRSVTRMLVLGTLFGAASTLAGLYASFYVNMPSGPAVVLTAAALFAAVFVVTGIGSLRDRRTARGGVMERPVG